MKTTNQLVEHAHKEWIGALDALKDLIFLHDKEFRILRCNRAYQEHSGMTFAQIIGQPYYEVFPKADAPLLHCAQVIESAKEDFCEDEIEIEGNFFFSRGFVIRDKNGDYLYSLHILEDVTEKHQIEKALRESEEKFRQITTSAQDAILMMDEKGNISYWNKAAETMFGYRSEETIGKDLHTLLAPERFHEAHRKGFEHFQKTGEGSVVGKTVELWALKKSGEEFPIELSLSIARFESGWNAIGIIRDSSERKKNQELLRRSEEQFRSLVESTSDWIWEVNAEGFYTYASPKVEELLGYTPEELLGTSPFELMPPEEGQRVGALFQTLIEAPKAVRGIENLNRCKDGSLKVLETSAVPVFNESGELTGYRGIDRDITERKRSEASLYRANRALKTLSAGNMALVRAKSEPELLQSVTDVIVQQAGYSLAVVVYAEDNPQKSITPMAGAGMNGFNRDWAENITWGDSPEGQLPVALAIRTGETQVCHSIACSIGLKAWKETSLAQGYLSNIALPLQNEGKTFGALCIYSSEENAFDENEIELLEELAGDLAYGIFNLRTRVKHEEQSLLLRQSLEQSIQTIAATVEARDPYTAGHQRRVAELAVAIARKMNLDEEQIQGIHFAAIIHDLGKIHIPAEILAKPGRLSNIEFMLIQTHPQEGYDILKDVKFPWPIAEAILQHHEKLDGSGYPRGLRGEEIRLEARILTVADVVEAMYSHRPYRAAMGIKAALSEIRSGRGSAYDPLVVDACLELFEKGKFSFNN